MASFLLLSGRATMLIGYVRMSTNDQNTDLQRNALNCAGCELIFEDKISSMERIGNDVFIFVRVR
ncbi:TPA: recombinase family protein [Escherichia coli]|nr:DNA invertase [Escherichia coli]HEI3202564.1 recombinase family protein [Escherichia coli]